MMCWMINLICNFNKLIKVKMLEQYLKEFTVKLINL